MSTAQCRAELSLDGALPVLRFTGSLMLPDPEAQLTAYLDAVHRSLVAARCHEVEVDFRQCEALCLSGFRAFSHWTEAVLAQPAAERYQLNFLWAPERAWQHISLLLLQRFGGGLVQLSTRPKQGRD